MQRPDFWNWPERFRVLSRYALMGVRAALNTARALEARLGRSEGRNGAYSRDLVSRLASQLYLLQHGLEDVFEETPVEVVLSVQPGLEAAADAAAALRWCERLLETSISPATCSAL